MESVGRWRAPWPLGPRRLFSGDVACPHYGPGRGDLPGVFEASHVSGGWAHIGPLVCLPGSSLVDRATAHSPRRQIDSRADPLPPEDFPEDLGLLRDLRRPGKSLAPP